MNIHIIEIGHGSMTAKWTRQDDYAKAIEGSAHKAGIRTRRYTVPAPASLTDRQITKQIRDWLKATRKERIDERKPTSRVERDRDKRSRSTKIVEQAKKIQHPWLQEAHSLSDYDGHQGE